MSNIIKSTYLRKRGRGGWRIGEIGGIGRGRRDDIGILTVNKGKGGWDIPLYSNISTAGRHDFDAALINCGSSCNLLPK